MLRKSLLLLTIVLTTQFVIAQHQSVGHLLITGKVTNLNEKTWSFGQTGFLGDINQQVEIHDDGSFNKSFKIEGMQDIYLNINNDAITFYVQPNDIIEIVWDDKDFNRTFKISSLSPVRNKELQLNLLLYNQFRQSTQDLVKKLSEKKTSADSEKFKWINDQYNKQLKSVLVDASLLTSNTEKFVYQIYYLYSRLLLTNKLLSKYSLTSDSKLLNPSNSALIKNFIPSQDQFKVLDVKHFFECPNYRNFLFDYVRFGNSLFNSYRTNSLYTQKTDITPSAPAFNDYYTGLTKFNILPIRDWFITNAIILSFTSYTFEESEMVLNDFLPKCKTKMYQDTLVSFYAMAKKFKSGNPAPNFTLENENGKLVSLKDFKGKIVYIDFWGVGCAPCRYEIANWVPKLYAKYATKDVIFINICVDVDKKTWKKALSEIKLEGINLIAEGWTHNKACKDYNINGVPHNILIDKQGRFVNSNMAKPSEIMNGINNDLDKLLLLKLKIKAANKKDIGFITDNLKRYKTINGGSSWQQIDNQPAWLEGLHFYSENEGFGFSNVAVYEGGDFPTFKGTYIFSTKDGGITWNRSGLFSKFSLGYSNYPALDIGYAVNGSEFHKISKNQIGIN